MRIGEQLPENVLRRYSKTLSEHTCCSLHDVSVVAAATEVSVFFPTHRGPQHQLVPGEQR